MNILQHLHAKLNLAQVCKMYLLVSSMFVRFKWWNGHLEGKKYQLENCLIINHEGLYLFLKKKNRRTWEPHILKRLCSQIFHFLLLSLHLYLTLSFYHISVLHFIMLTLSIASLPLLCAHFFFLENTFLSGTENKLRLLVVMLI